MIKSRKTKKKQNSVQRRDKSENQIDNLKGFIQHIAHSLKDNDGWNKRDFEKTMKQRIKSISSKSSKKILKDACDFFLNELSDDYVQ